MRLRLTLLTVLVFTLGILSPLIVLAQAEGARLPGDAVRLEQWTLVTSFFLPPLIAVIQQRGWSSATQALVAFGVSAVVTLLHLAIAGELDRDNLADPAGTVLLVTALTITFYKGFWKPTGIAPTIEARTNLA